MAAMIGTDQLNSGSAIRWSIDCLSRRFRLQQQVAPHVQADQAVEVAAAHPQRGQLAEIGDDDDVAIAELCRDGVDGLLRLRSW